MDAAYDGADALTYLDAGNYDALILDVTTQHIAIYYNCIGAFSAPDRRNIPATQITMGTRKGVAVSCSRSRIAI